MQEMELVEIRIDESNWWKPQVILLKEKYGDRFLPILIGLFEAHSIYLKIHNKPPARPFTHDLMIDIVDHLGAKIEKVLVDELKFDTFYAKLFLINAQGEEVVIDSRPSDAIALALRAGAPIYVDEEVLAQASITEPEE